MVKIYESIVVYCAIFIIGIIAIGMLIYTIGEWVLKKLNRAFDNKINSVLDFS